MLSACHFRKKQLQEGRYMDDFTAERRAEVNACRCYHWTADVFQGAEDCGLNSQSNMLFWKAEKPSAVSYLWGIPEHWELTGCESQRHPLWGSREEPACSPFLSCYPVISTLNFLKKCLKPGILIKKTPEKILHQEIATRKQRRKSCSMSNISFFFY